MGIKAFIITFFIFLFSSFSQVPIELYKAKDSIIKMSEFHNNNLDSLLLYSKKLQLSSNNCDKLSAYEGEAYYYYRNKKYEKVKALINNAIKASNLFINQSPNNICYIRFKAVFLNRLFWTYKNLEEYETAYKLLVQLSDYVNSIRNEKIDKFLYTINIEIYKAQIKNDLNLEIDSKKILKRLIRKLESNTNKFNDSLFYPEILAQAKANTYNLLGNTYMELNKKKHVNSFLDSASFYFKKAYNITKNFSPPHPDSELMYAYRKTKVLIAQKKYEKALLLVNDYAKISNGYDYLKNQNFNKAICYHNLKKSDSAIYYAKKLLKNKILKKSKLITIYDILLNQYLKKNQLDSALKYSKLTLLEFNKARENKQKTYQLLYDNDIEKVKNLNNIILQKEKRKNTQNIAIISCILFLISIFFLFKRKKYKTQISDNKTIANIETPKTEEVLNKKTKKVAYNIEEDLENKILNKLQEIELHHSYIQKDFSVNTIAEDLETNSTYISFVFNKHHSITFKQYYTQKKIEYIVQLLQNNNVYRNFSIQGLAEEVGYTNASAFTRAFKKHMNITPSAYIKSLNG